MQGISTRQFYGFEDTADDERRNDYAAANINRTGAVRGTNATGRGSTSFVHSNWEGRLAQGRRSVEYYREEARHTRVSHNTS